MFGLMSRSDVNARRSVRSRRICESLLATTDTEIINLNTRLVFSMKRQMKKSSTGSFSNTSLADTDLQC